MGLTVYSPLAQGILTGKYVDLNEKKWIIPPGSRAEISEGVRKMLTDENLKKVIGFIEFARAKGVTPTQLALAWILKKSEELGVTIIPIVGVTKVNHLEEAMGALEVNLSQDDLKSLEELGKKQ